MQRTVVSNVHCEDFQAVGEDPSGHMPVLPHGRVEYEIREKAPVVE